MNGKPSSFDELIQRAIEGVREIQKKTPDELKQWLTSRPLIPPTIPSGQGFYFITAEGLAALHDLGRTWHQNDPANQKVLTREVAGQTAVEAFGDLMAAAKTFPGDSDVKTELLRILKERIHNRIRPEHFYFPAHVFEQEDVASFDVGPVSFYRRNDWLDAVEQIAQTPPAWKQEVLARWSRRPKLRERAVGWFKRRILKQPVGHGVADDVTKTIGACRWVITVPVEGRERHRAAECATVAATVALDSLGLTLEPQITKSFRGPGDELEVRMTRTFSQFEGASAFNSTVSVNLPNIGGRPGAQANLLSATRKLRTAVGNTLKAFVSVTPACTAPMLRHRWVEAMYWFGQARRERVEFIALVKYGICLDVLAKGTQFKGILKLCSEALGKTEADAMTSDGRALSTLVKRLYDEGRSQIAHGGRPVIMQELPIELHLADSLARQVLLAYVAALDLYAGPDVYEDFLATLPQLRVQYLAPPPLAALSSG